MKTVALLAPSTDAEPISIDEALYLREIKPVEYEQLVFYSPTNFLQMKPVYRKYRKSSFSYLPGSGRGHGNGSKGVGHELVQAELCNAKQLEIEIVHSIPYQLRSSTRYTLLIDSADDEVEFKCPIVPGRNYFTDVVLYLNPASELYEECNGIFRIEVIDTKGTHAAKRQAMREFGHFCVDFKLWKGWHVPKSENPSAGKIKWLRNSIRGALKKSVLRMRQSAPDSAVNFSFSRML
ncbi:MAG: hypothetical protein JW963_08425 [Anaerolineales bacterium]|nr:hypothetical protein [Anaerolineales bacterium]